MQITAVGKDAHLHSHNPINSCKRLGVVFAGGAGPYFLTFLNDLLTDKKSGLSSVSTLLWTRCLRSCSATGIPSLMAFRSAPYPFKCSSYLLNLANNSASENRCLRFLGGKLAGEMHWTPAFLQFAQGIFLSHLTLRC